MTRLPGWRLRRPLHRPLVNQGRPPCHPLYRRPSVRRQTPPHASLLLHGSRLSASSMGTARHMPGNGRRRRNVLIKLLDEAAALVRLKRPPPPTDFLLCPALPLRRHTGFVHERDSVWGSTPRAPGLRKRKRLRTTAMKLRTTIPTSKNTNNNDAIDSNDSISHNNNSKE